jgi:hypothetical protein
LAGGAAGKVSSSTVNATANTCTGAASATVKVGGVTHTLTDSNMANNTCGCL